MQSREKYFVLPNQSLHTIPKDIENIYFGRYGSRDLTVLDFSSFGFTHLRSITIGCNCFHYVDSFVLDGLEKLESVKIGEGCFSGWYRQEESICRIANCPNLRQLEIGDRSFYDFNQFELSNVSSLQSITFDESCFKYAENCILKGK